MLTIDSRKAEGPFALLHLGFRPFFLGAGAFAVLSVLIWMGAYVFGWPLGAGTLPPFLWHGHEMVFGYSLAVIAGFLLTAVRNWTGIQTVHGPNLLLLALLWLGARLVPFLGPYASLAAMAVLDNLFLILLFIAVAQPIVKARQWQQIGILSKLALLLASNLLFYSGVLGFFSNGVRWGMYSGLYLVLSLIFVMGRRVIPAFIQNGVDYPIELRNRKWVDIASLVLFFAFWILDVVWPDSGPVALLALALCLVHTVRLVDWYTHGIWRKPLLWVLYLAYGWLVVGFALKASVFAFALSPYAALHAFAFGGIGMMTLGMMCRVALGHTGRNVFEPPPILFWMFGILFLGTIARVFLPLFDQAHYVQWIGVSQLLWILSFLIFLVVYAPMLVRPRVDGRYG